MRTLALLAILQNLTTGAFVAACAEAGATAADWLSCALLLIGNCLFSFHVVMEGLRAARP